MDLDRLALLHEQSAYQRVFDAGDGVEAFLIALRAGATYDSMNYRWVRTALRALPLHRPHRGLQFGARQRRQHIAVRGSLRIRRQYASQPGVTCEFDLDPPNEPSRRFHQGFGLSAVGSQRVGPQRKLVSLQAAWPASATSQVESSMEIT
jgi:uncharacterized protein